MSKRIRRAKEAAKDRIRSVQTHVHHRSQASRGRGRVLPPPSLKKEWGRSSPGVTLSSIDDDFEAALNDEFNNPLFLDSEGGWQLLEHPSNHHLQGRKVLGRDSSGLENSLGEEDAPDFEERQSDPLLGQSVAEVGTVVRKSENEVVSEHQTHDTTPTPASMNGVHTSSNNASTLKQIENEPEVPPPQPTEPLGLLSSSEENLIAENSPSEREDVKNCGEDGQHAHTTVEQPGTRIIVTDEKLEEKLEESQNFASPESQGPDAAHSPLDFSNDAFPDETELMTELDLDLPSVDELMEHGIEHLRPEDPLSPHESPLSSLPSSYEDDSNFLTNHPVAAIVEQEVQLQTELEDNKPKAEGYPGGTVNRNSPDGKEVGMGEAHHEETKLKESVATIEKSEIQDSTTTAAQQRERHACTQEGGNRAHSSSPAPADNVPDSRLLTQSSDHPMLTTTTKHPLTPGSPTQSTHQRREERYRDKGAAGIGSFEIIEKDDDLFSLQEDYFAAEHSKKQSRKIKPPRPSGPIPSVSSRAPVLTKRNSEGRVPPPRPKYSPNLQRRNRHSKPSSFGGKSTSEKHDTGEDRAQVKVGKTSPPRVSPRATVSPSPENILSNSHRQNDTQSNDELFPDDIVQQSGTQRLSLPNDTKDGQIQASNATKADNAISEPESSELDDDATSFPIEYHLLVAGLLYFYYSLNFSDYLAGLLAGFLLVYLTLGVVFVYYVHQVEKKEEVGEKRSSTVQLSDSFVKRMNVNFDTVRVYKSKNFMATWKYDFATHHPSQRIMSSLVLVDDFDLTIKVWDSEHVSTQRIDARQCSFTLVPEEVAQNRKRRWSKKFPIRISWPEKKYCVYIFTHTSREKEDWFRRLKSAASGITSDDLIIKQKNFFAYMEQYFPTDSPHSDASVAHGRLRKRGSLQSQAVRQPSPRVKYHADSEEEGGVSISRPSLQHPGRQPPAAISSFSIAAETSVDPVPQAHTGVRTSSTSTLRSLDSLDESSYEFVPRPLKPPKETDWINSLAARLCWDVWHEERWKNWVMSRIQRKLIRVKTPSFMEQLRLTDVQLGKDMPVINRLFDGPKLDMQGIWVYLDVTYVGLFVMTIETKLKFGKKEEDEGEEGAKGGTQKGPSFTKAKDSVRISPQRPKAPPHLHPHGGVKAMALESPVDPQEEIDSGSDDEGASLSQSVEEAATQAVAQAQVVLESDPHSPVPDHTHSRRKALMNVVTKIGKRVANTKIVRRAAEKVSSYPLVLTVEVNRLDGILAVNVPPPPTDTIWYGFKSSPTLDLVAKPKLGHREVTLTKVTHWIEKKLHELVNKKLVLPNMEDLVIPILNSGLAEDKQQELSPPTPH